MKYFIMAAVSLTCMIGVAAEPSIVDATNLVKSVKIVRGKDGLKLAVTVTVCHFYPFISYRLNKLANDTVAVNLITFDSCNKKATNAEFLVSVPPRELSALGVDPATAKILFQIQ